MPNLAAEIFNTFCQINDLKQLLESAAPKDIPRLRQQLKELQILHLWHMSQVKHDSLQDAVVIAVARIQHEKVREK